MRRVLLVLHRNFSRLTSLKTSSLLSCSCKIWVAHVLICAGDLDKTDWFRMRKVEKTGAVLGADSQTQTIYSSPQTQLPRNRNCVSRVSWWILCWEISQNHISIRTEWWLFKFFLKNFFFWYIKFIKAMNTVDWQWLIYTGVSISQLAFLINRKISFCLPSPFPSPQALLTDARMGTGKN